MDAGDLPDSRFLRRLARLQGVAVRDVDDIVQDALERIWVNRADVDPDRCPESWTRKVLTNEARQHHRSARSRREILTAFEEHDEVRDTGRDPEEEALYRARLALLRELSAKIHESRRTIFLEHHLLNMSIAELAERHALSEETVKTRLKLARQDIKEASLRWQAEQRRRGGDILPVFLLPIQRLDLRGGSRRALGALRGGRAMLALFAASAVIAGILVLASRSSAPPSWPVLMRLPSAGFVLPTRGDEREPHATPTQVEPAEVIAGGGVISAVTNDRTGYSPREDTLLGRARVAMKAGQNGLARRLLAEHAREFPRGHRAREREALLRTMR